MFTSTHAFPTVFGLHEFGNIYPQKEYLDPENGN